MKVERIIFREMGDYNDISLRPFKTDFDRNKIDILAEATDGGRHLTVSNLSRMSVGMMRPSTESHGVADILSGWGEKRLMFMMDVEIVNSTKSVVREIITGYTDYIGASQLDSRNVRLDPNMRLIFNSTFNVKQSQAYGANGNEWRTNIFNSSQIVSRNRESDFSRRDGFGTMTMRPEDVVIRNNVSGGFHELSNDSGFRDTRAEFGGRALKLSRRSNTQSASYLSRTLSALRDSETDDFLETDDSVRLSEARGKLREQSITNNKVMEMLMTDTSIMSEGFVTWDELTSMNPDLDKRTDVFFAKRTEPVHRRGDTENWGGSDNETLAATIAASAIPSYLIDAMYSEIDFTCTNDTIGGEFVTTVGRLIPFIPDTNVAENYNLLVSRIEHEMMPEILFNQMMSVFIRVKSSLYGDTTIDISFDNDPEARFVFPSFCDSVASPILTNSREVIDTMAHDISQIHTELHSRDRSSFNEEKIFIPNKGRHI